TETWSRCRRLAGALTQLGVQPGERVAILALNSHQYLEVYLAVPASGRVVVPLNTRHAEPELRYALEDSGTRVLITDRDPGALAQTVERVISLLTSMKPCSPRRQRRSLAWASRKIRWPACSTRAALPARQKASC